MIMPTYLPIFTQLADMAGDTNLKYHKFYFSISNRFKVNLITFVNCSTSWRSKVKNT